MAILCLGVKGFSQDSTMQKQEAPKKNKHHWPPGMDSAHHHWHDWPMDGAYDEDWDHWPPYHWSNKVKPSNLTTNWLIVDLGFANYQDNTNYASASAQAFAPGSSKYWFDLKNNKSVDVNIWLFMQRLNVVKHVVNLKYGLGIELNNYRYVNNITYLTEPTEVVFDSIQYSKNKLAADYVTVPLMINFNFTPTKRQGFGLSFGVSAGYLYSSRQKTISSEFGKKKTFNSFDLNPWKISWIAEAQLGPVILYGSLATKSMFSQGLDQVPYTFGIRLSHW